MTRGCDICGSRWPHRFIVNALLTMTVPSPRWPKRHQAIQSCFECWHPMLVMQGVSRDVTEVRL